MRQFNQLKVQTKQSFVGEKIFIEEILNKSLIVDDYSVRPSTKNPGTMCLWMQITYEGKKRIVFTSSTFLIDQLEQVGEEDFPFQATLIKVNRHFEFK